MVHSRAVGSHSENSEVHAVRQINQNVAQISMIKSATENSNTYCIITWMKNWT